MKSNIAKQIQSKLNLLLFFQVQIKKPDIRFLLPQKMVRCVHSPTGWRHSCRRRQTRTSKPETYLIHSNTFCFIFHNNSRKLGHVYHINRKCDIKHSQTLEWNTHFEHLFLFRMSCLRYGFLSLFPFLWVLCFSFLFF